MDWLFNFLSQGSEAGILGGNLSQSIPRLVIAISTFAIAIAASSFLWRRRDLPPVYRRVALSLALLLFAIAVSFGMVGVFPDTRPLIFARMIEIVAAVSALVAVFLIRFVLPQLLALPSPRLLERSNRHLKSEIDAHIDTMRQLTDIRSDLEEKVLARTRELTATKQRFEAALSGSDISVFNQDTDLAYTWAYDARRDLTPEQVVGKTDGDLFPADVAPTVADAKRGVVASGKGTSLNVVVKTDGASQYLRLSIEPLRDSIGEIIGLTSAVVDLTERHDYETRLSALTSGLAEANARFDMALRGSSIMMFSHDRDLRYNWIYNPAIGLNADDMIGRTDQEFWPDGNGMPIVEMKRAAVASGEAQHGEIVMTLDGKPRYFQLRLEPILGTGRTVEGLAGVAVDVTEAHQQELHLRLVMRELTHRSKNLLAVIQAMARQTAARSDDPQTFVVRFSARLRAMAASHDLLVAREWHGATLTDLVHAQLSQAIDPGSDQLQIQGPMLSLRPDAVQNIGLALHELTTNASKYGALSVPDGKISLTWAIHGGDRLHLRWEETNGPTVQLPQKTGFGVTLLERSVGQALDGIVKLEFTPSGVVCEIDIPSSHAID